MTKYDKNYITQIFYFSFIYFLFWNNFICPDEIGCWQKA